ncbi:phosphonate metabolism protein PhnP [Enterovibrio coralii]|uniref:Phosphonate metabolism protein PhnP n=1 Tax=Enterovibrio coralii TaxID=294935 RepID=A0A135IC87_9GAMM|nr:phosphonate metabolism protein PhnP [Enterovibrio coralii]KXF83076.1 phosphonate metabolism protein PhnP [Enterovibrio coralii]
MLKLTLLGTGAAGGVPLYGCECPACERATMQPAFERRPCSAMVEWGRSSSQERLIIDAGLMDLHARFPAGTYKGFLLTHFHVDHVQGFFHMRWGKAESIPVWCPDDPEGCADLLKNPGCLRFLPEMKHAETMTINGLRVTPLAMKHSRPTFGYLLEFGTKSIAYLTDTEGLPAHTMDFLRSQRRLNALVLDCSFPPNHDGTNHGDIENAKRIYEVLNPDELIITHIGHELDHWLMNNDVPDWLEIGREGMTI